MQDIVESISDIYPAFEKKINLLFRTDENFRDLCADYVLCATTLERLENESAERSDEIDEYKDLKQTLKAEILHFLTKN